MSNGNLFNNEMFIDFLDALYIGVHIVNKEGETLAYNTKCEEIEGIERQWIMGRKLKDLVETGVYNESVGLKVLEEKRQVRKTQRVNKKHVYSTGIPIYYKEDLAYVVVSVADMSSLSDLELQLRELEAVNKLIQRELEISKSLLSMDNPLVFKSKEMEAIKLLALRVAKVDSTVLISGESGVGKGVLSQFIHDNSNRKDGAFVKIDCSGLPASLIESELFGYVGGAFTGASREGKKGLVELAENGSLFLDEIGELDLGLQVKLLQLIQEKKFKPVGGTDYISVDTRIISASNRDLKEMVKKGTFRGDLYYRLNVIPIRIPPLRERRVDIVPLIKHFLNKNNQKYGSQKKISSQAMKKLINYSWPGNIRELENEIERLVVISDTRVIHEDYVLFDRSEDQSPYNSLDRSFRENVLDFERDLLKDYLSSSKDIKDLSKKTGLEASSLRKKAKRLGLDLEYGGKIS